MQLGLAWDLRCGDKMPLFTMLYMIGFTLVIYVVKDFVTNILGDKNVIYYLVHPIQWIIRLCL